jgi:hypothetical protein
MPRRWYRVHLRHKLNLLLLVGALGYAVAGVGDATAAAGLYSLAPTQKCLRAAGATVTKVRRTDRRRIAISDLAQRTSFEARRRGKSVLFAFAKGPSEASLLRELLFAPNDTYTLVVKNNVVIMYQQAARKAATTAIGCLRPR